MGAALLAAVLSSAVVIGAPVVPAATSGAGDAAEAQAANVGVKWDLWPDAKTVEVKVKIDFWMEKRAPTQGEMDTVTKTIINVWDGKPILCGTLKVTLTVDGVKGNASLKPDAIGIRLVAAKTAMGPSAAIDYTRSYIDSSPGSPTMTQQGDSTSDVSIPTVGPVADPKEQSRMWLHDSRWPVFAHEFGHVLGLRDTYDAKSQWIAGTAFDIMSDAAKFNVAEESLVKAARRGGVDLTRMNCARHLTTTPIDLPLKPSPGDLSLDQMQIDAWNCAWVPPSSDPKRLRDMNMWEGKLTYEPRVQTADALYGFSIEPRFTADGVKTEKVRFDTMAARWLATEVGTRDQRWEVQHVLFNDKDINIGADLRLRDPSQSPKGEALKVVVRFTIPGQQYAVFGTTQNQTLKIDVVDKPAVCPPP